MKTCISEREFNVFFDDSMSDEELARLESHLKECAACRAEYGKWKALKQVIAEAGNIPVPVTLKSRVMEGVHKVRTWNSTSPPGLKEIAAVIGLLLLCGAYYIFPSFSRLLVPFLQETAAFFSEILYGIISLAGLDMQKLAAFFKASIPVISQLAWFFAAGTVMLVAGFFSLIVKGGAGLKEN